MSRAVIETWNGSQWTENDTGTFEDIHNLQILDAVACSDHACFVTGEYGDAGEPFRFLLKLAKAPVTIFQTRVSAGDVENGIDAESGCVRSGPCMFVESADFPKKIGGPFVSFTSESGSSEFELPMADPLPQVDSLSCVSAHWCLIVGEEIIDSATINVYMDVWNGKSVSSEFLSSPAKGIRVDKL